MPLTVIVECQSCHGLLLAGKQQKTHTCPYCGVKVQVQKAKRLAAAETAFQASEMLRKLKTQQASATKKMPSTIQAVQIAKTKLTHNNQAKSQNLPQTKAKVKHELNATPATNKNNNQ